MFPVTILLPLRVVLFRLTADGISDPSGKAPIAGGNMGPGQNDSRQREFRALAEEILQDRWKASPVSATRDGIHEWDRDLDSFDPDFRQQVLTRRKEELRALESFSDDRLPSADRIDRRLLINSLISEIADWEEFRWYQRDPGICFSLVLQGVYFLRVREFAPPAERARCILDRMGQIPRLIREGMGALVDPPRVFIDLALTVGSAGKDFFLETARTLGEEVPVLAAGLSRAGNEAGAALDRALEELRGRYLPDSGESFAAGERLFGLKLRVDHALTHTAADLWEMGEQAAADTEALLEDEALKIAGSRDWRSVLAELRRNHPEPHELLAVYRREMERARAFVLDRGLAELPSGEELEVVPTPPFERPTTPYAALVPAAPFEEMQKGFFYVTPVDERLAARERRERLSEHCLYAIPVIACHEGYPGHHLQLSRANRHPSRVRRVLGTPVLWEGWALYCEEMMHEEGFYEDSRCRLFQLKDQLWRACRILADVGLHVRGKSRRWAVDLLVERAGLARSNAAMEVDRYCATPTYQLSYYVGKRQILELRDRWRKQRGPAAPLGEFHNWFLSYGSLPPGMIPL